MTPEQRWCDDAQLLAAGSQGLAVLYDRHARAVFRLAAGLLGDLGEADEVVQETFLLAWRKRRQVTVVDGSALPWLLTTGRFEALAARRKAAKRASRQVEFVPELHDRAVGGGVEGAVSEVLAELTDRDRAVIEAVLVDGMTYAEAAAVLDVPVSTVGKRLQRARRRARNRLCAEGDAAGEGAW